MGIMIGCRQLDEQGNQSDEQNKRSQGRRADILDYGVRVKPYKEVAVKMESLKTMKILICFWI